MAKFLIKRNNCTSEVLDKSNKWRFQNEFTDAILSCQGIPYPVHKVVLSSFSSYFEDIFINTPCKFYPSVVLTGIVPSELEALLTYIYTGETTIEKSNLQSLLNSAKIFKIEGLCDFNNFFGSHPSKKRKREEVSSPCSFHDDDIQIKLKDEDLINENEDFINDEDLIIDEENISSSTINYEDDVTSNADDVNIESESENTDSNFTKIQKQSELLTSYNDGKETKLISEKIIEENNFEQNTSLENFEEANILSNNSSPISSIILRNKTMSSALDKETEGNKSNTGEEQIKHSVTGTNNLNVSNQNNCISNLDSSEKKKVQITTIERECKSTIFVSSCKELLEMASECFGGKQFLRCVYESTPIEVTDMDIMHNQKTLELLLLKEGEEWTPSKLSSSITARRPPAYFKKCLMENETFPWKDNFPLPKFEEDVERCLKKKNIACKTKGNYLFLSIINSLYEEASKYFLDPNRVPTGTQCFAICTALIDTYPFLINNDKETTSLWCNSLTAKFNKAKRRKSSINNPIGSMDTGIKEYEEAIKNELSSETPSADNVSVALENTHYFRLSRMRRGSCEIRAKNLLDEALYRNRDMLYFDMNLILMEAGDIGQNIYQMEENLERFIEAHWFELKSMCNNCKKSKTQLRNHSLNNCLQINECANKELTILLMSLLMKEDPFKFYTKASKKKSTVKNLRLEVDSYINPTCIDIILGQTVVFSTDDIISAITMWYCLSKITEISMADSKDFIGLVEFISGIKDNVADMPEAAHELLVALKEIA